MISTARVYGSCWPFSVRWVSGLPFRNSRTMYGEPLCSPTS